MKKIGATTTISRVPTAHPWEYIVGGLPVSDTSISQTDVLNDWGRDGWELVSVVFSPEQGGAPTHNKQSVVRLLKMSARPVGHDDGR